MGTESGRIKGMRSKRFLVGALSGSVALSVFAAATLIAAGSSHTHPTNTRLVRAQNPSEPDFDEGSILLADRDLKDANFAQSVILIVRYDDEGTLGLILNRPTKVPISEILEDWKEAKDRTEPVFFGGPVESSSLLALFRSRAQVDQAHRVIPEVHVIAERSQMQKNLVTGGTPDKLRLYVGYVGWAPEQLEEEVDLGAWHVYPGDVNLVFDSDPDTLWTRLIKGVETQIAWQPPKHAVLAE
jgi:putative transcriptional regulator